MSGLRWIAHVRSILLTRSFRSTIWNCSTSLWWTVCPDLIPTLFQPSFNAPQGLQDVIVCRIFHIASWNSDRLWICSSRFHGMLKQPLLESFCLQKICECSLMPSAGLKWIRATWNPNWTVLPSRVWFCSRGLVCLTWWKPDASFQQRPFRDLIRRLMCNIKK